MNAGLAVSSRLALQRFFAHTDFLTSKTLISRRSSPGSAAPFKGSRLDRLVFMLSTLSTSQAAKRGAHGDNISLASKCSGCGRPLGQVFKRTTCYAAPRWQVKATGCAFFVKLMDDQLSLPVSCHTTHECRTELPFRARRPATVSDVGRVC